MASSRRGADADADADAEIFVVLVLKDVAWPERG
jgi:hypothetical protein